MKLYLDNCCFNRPYDDQSYLRIMLEAEAKLKIQENIRNNTYQLIWSYILDYENNKNPFRERRVQIATWREYAIEDIQANDDLLNIARRVKKQGFKKMDSLHIACAISAGVDFFLTTDDGIIKKAASVNETVITDPIGFIKEALP